MKRNKMSVFRTALAALAVFLGGGLATTLFAKSGVVTIDDKDNTAYVGEITEKGDQYVIKSGENNIQINKGNVKNVTYFDTFKQEFDYRLKALPADDAAGRAQLAAMAVDHKEDDLALQAANSALKIDPKNATAKKIADDITKKQPAPPVNPANPPVAPTQTGPRKISGKTRLVTLDEINRIRQIEWRPDDANVRVKIDPDVRGEFVAKSGIRPADFNRLPANDQGRMILSKGTKNERKGVHILTDPPTMQEFKTRVQKVLVQNCTVAGCHDGSNKKTTFVLHIPDEKVKELEEEATYSNFLILQDYSTVIEKVQHDMIDRANPNQSLLTQYLLAPGAANTPHPKVEGFKGAFKGANDPRYRAIAQWAQSLPVIEPDYEVDLMKAAKEDKAPAKEAGKELPPAAPDATPAVGGADANK